jgi:hypothetical protein
MRGFCTLALLMLVASGQAWAAPPELAYRIVEGQNLNAFVRDGKVAAHLLLRNGVDPRILVAFPAGNSGVGLWFETTAKPVTWRIDSDLQPLTTQDAKGRPLYGIKTLVTIDAARLTVKQAVLSNVRFLRDYQAVGKFPAEVATTAVVAGDTITYARDRIDGASGYRLVLRVVEGRIDGTSIIAGASGQIRLEMTAASGDPPLTPLTLPELLNTNAAADPIARDALHFLSYREKFLAGSWRFNTYFGRDTLMSVRLLMPALQPAAIEAGLNSVLARLSPGGEVSHEEGISEFAIVQNRKAGRDGDTAEEDYKMVDDDYMLAAVLADYVAGPGAARAKDYLALPLKSEANPALNETTGAALVRNLRFVLAQAAPFAAEPVAGNLIAIKPGFMAGQWRDSDEGIGRGRYAYDVNAALVPAALDATALLLRQGLLDPYLTAKDRATFARAGAMARVWHDRAAPFFRVSFTPQDARQRITAYAASVGVPAAPAVRAIGNAPAVYHAISLDAEHKPVPIVHSDEGFVLLFGQPSPADLDAYIVPLLRPFPAGLLTDIGMLTANPAFVDKTAQAHFMSSAYHGAGVWSWQQALFAAGLERQLARRDLPSGVRARLLAAQSSLWRVIRATRALQSSELWSWKYADGRYQVVAFGAGKADVDESNAAQLWSTVYLAVKPPVATPRRKKR